ncbi:MAG: hypothetical protein HZA01_06510 [Nitrospinae bacterium]|nr:hypothetical protein [Nitrospinota bacterium]
MKKIFLFSHVLACVLSLTVSASAGESSIAKPEKGSALSTSKDCGECHKRIHQEWSGTMHASSTPEKDPLVKAFYGYLAAEKFDVKKCDKCHVPFRALYPDEDNKDLSQEGVNCVFCHSVHGKADSGKQGIDYYKLDFLKSVTGPSQGDAKKAAHDAQFIGLFRHVDICSGCHQSGEADYYHAGESQAVCQQCHMPTKQKETVAEDGKVRDKVYRHLFEGGHSEDLLSMAAIISGEAKKSGGKTSVKLSLENSALHPIPGGFPLRAIYVKLTGLDAKGKEVWSNYAKDPRKEDPKGYFALAFPEAEEVYAHYAKEIKPSGDTRIKATEAKELAYEIPSDKVESVRVRLFYRPLPETVLKKLRIDPGLAPETLMMEETIAVAK